MKRLIDIITKKDRSLADRINVAKRYAETLWLRSLDPKNGYKHSSSIERYLNRLLPDEIKEKMTAAEIFILLYSTYLHDIGRKVIGKKGHEKTGSEEIEKNYQDYFLNEHEARAVSIVSYGHASEEENPINNIKRDYGLNNLDPEKNIDLRFLAALLRLADEIDNAFTRVWGLPEHEESERNKINFVSIDQSRWIITYQHGSLTEDIRNLMLLSVEKAQKRLDEIKEVLESRGILFHLIDADPLLPDLRTYRALGNIRADYLRRLQKSFMYLDVRGILQVRKIVRIKLEDVYIPLHAVPEKLLQPLSIEEQLEDENNADLSFLNIHQMIEPRKGEYRQSMKEILKNNRIVILGAPGSGKSTLIKYIALTIADENVSEKFGLPWGILPIIVSIRSYADALKENSRLSLKDFLPVYCEAMDFCNVEDISDLFSIELQNGNCMIFLDGLDEVRGRGLRIEVGTRIKNFIDEYGSKNRIVVTSRIAGYLGVQLPGDSKHFVMAEFNDNEIQKFTEKWCLAFEEMTKEGSIAVKNAKNEAEKLLYEINSNSGIRRLASNPLLLTILALVHYQGMRLPPRRVDLYELCVKTLTETWNLARNIAGIRLELWLGNRPLDERNLITILGPIAFWMHEKGEVDVSRKTLEAMISKELQNNEGLSHITANNTASDFLDLIVEYSGLLVEYGLDSFRFMHNTFQEYLTARRLTGMRDVNNFILSRLDDPRWREPILLTAASLEGDYAKDFVRSITQSKDRYESILHRHLILSAWCLVDDAQVSRKLYLKILDDMERVYENPVTPEGLRKKINDVLIAMKGSINEPFSHNILDKALLDSNTEVRFSAVWALGKIGGERAIDPMIEILKDPDPNVRSGAPWALGKIGGERAIDLLIEALKDPAPNVRSGAVWALGKIGGERAIDPLIEALKDPQSSVRAIAYSSINLIKI